MVVICGRLVGTPTTLTFIPQSQRIYCNTILSSATCKFVGSDRILLSQLLAQKFGRRTTLRGGFPRAWEPTHLTLSEMPIRRRGVIPRQTRTVSTFLLVKPT